MVSSNHTIIDEVSGWLRIFADGTVDRTWTGPPEARFLMEPVPPYHTPRNGLSVHDLQNIDNGPTLRLYFPQTENKNLPILLHFHGGGFCISHATWLMYHQFYTRLARAIPAVVVSPFLPLAPEHRLPAALDASYSALLSLHSIAHKESYNKDNDDLSIRKLQKTTDFSRVFLIGDSSGGNIVHHVAARAGKEEDGFWSPVRLAGAIPIHPGFVRETRSRSELEGKQEPLLTLDMLDKFLAYGLPEGATKDHPYTCPMMGEGLEELKLPAFLVGVAEGDLIRDTNLEYVDAMKKAGKEVEVVVSEGVGHSFYLNKVAVEMDPVVGKRAEELVEAIKDFVHRH